MNATTEPNGSAAASGRTGGAAAPSGSTAHYRKPDVFTKNIFNGLVAWLTRLGLSVWGSRVLEVRGRTSGKPRRVPVNLLALHGAHYLVSPRGQTEWVRNVRAAGGRLDLLLGRTRTAYVATELDGADKVPVLRSYLKRWKFEVGMFFDGVDADSTDAELEAIAPRHPVFMLVEAGPRTEDEAEAEAEMGAGDGRRPHAA